MPKARPRTAHTSDVVFRPDSGDLFTLNATGMLIWKFYARGHSAEAIARRISKCYGIGRAEAQRDVFDFLAEVHRHGLTIRA